MLTLLPHPLALSKHPTYDAETAPPLCTNSTATRTRVAAFGDSLTNGDATANWPRFPLRVEPNLRCRLGVSKTCRGHYPRVLAALLGPTYEVQVFAHSGMAATHLAQSVDACLNASSGAVLPPQSRNCTRQLALHSRLNDVIEWRPDIVLMMLGTNDAIEHMFEKFGYDGTRYALQHAVLALLHNSPLVLVITPPPTIVDAPAQNLCIRMHTCNYGGPLACWTVRECLTCRYGDADGDDPRKQDWATRARASDVKHYSDKGPRDETSGCVRVDLLNDIRRKVVDPLQRGLHKLHGVGGAGVPAQEACARGHVAGLGGDATSGMWQPQFFEGLYHFNPVGSAMIACLVHKKLLSLCGAAGACARSAAASRRHNEFCGELEELARPAPLGVRVPEEGAGDERPKARGGFWELEARLYAEYNESVVSGYVGDY